MAIPSSQYWRLRVVDASVQTDSQFVRFGEVELADSESGSDLTSPSLAATQAIGYPSASAANAFDDNDTTYWDSGTGGLKVTEKWVGWNFGSPVSLAEVRFKSTNSSGYLADYVIVERSDDGVTWVEAWIWTGLAYDGTVYVSRPTDSPMVYEATQVRIRAQSAYERLTTGTVINSGGLTSGPRIAGDLALAFVMHRSAITSVPSGWELVATEDTSSSTLAFQAVSIYQHRIASDGESTAASWSQASSGRFICFQVSYYGLNGQEVSIENIVSTSVDSSNIKAVQSLPISTDLEGSRGLVVISSINAPDPVVWAFSGGAYLDTLNLGDSQVRLTAAHTPGDMSLVPGADYTFGGEFVLDGENSNNGMTAISITLSVPPGPPESVMGFDYEIIGHAEKSITSDYRVGLPPVEKTETFDYSIEASGPFLSSVTMDFSVEEDTISFYTDFSSDYGFSPSPVAMAKTLNMFPMEPVREGWSWLTQVNITWSSKEQRIAMRSDPRILVSQPVAIPTEEVRVEAYQQLYEVMGTMPYLPMFHYATHLQEVTLSGNNEVFFDRARTWVQTGDTVAIYDPQSREVLQSRVTSLTSTGAILANSFPHDLREGWQIMPSLHVRLPNLSSLNMEALSGQYTLAGEQCDYREFRREGSTYELPQFEGLSVIPQRPVAVSSIVERFDTNSQVIDNKTGLPRAYSGYPNPFIDGTMSWLVDRETSMDFWRDFLWSLRGQQGIFYLSTWREDLVLLEVQPTFIRVQGQDYLEKFDLPIYQCLQLESEGSLVWRRVVSVSEVDDGLELSLSEALTDLEVHTVSFLNRVRLNADIIYLDHYRHHTIVALPIRTVNE